MKVRYSKRYGGKHRYLPELLTWVGRRLKATTHLAIHIDYPLWQEYSRCTVNVDDSDPLSHLLSSDPGLNVNLETLDLAMGDWWSDYDDVAHLSWLRDWVLHSGPRLKTVSLALERAPTWLMQCSSLRHLCLYFPCRLAASKDDAVLDSRDSIIFTDLPSNLNDVNLPNLQTLFLQGVGHDLGGINFQGSGSLEVVHVKNCWLNEFYVPPSCELRVSAQSERLIMRMDKSRAHPLVGNASYVCLPTNLAERVTPDGCCSDDDEEIELRESAVGIPDIFSNMRSLRLTYPQKASEETLESHLKKILFKGWRR
ncbi:g7044 [Coccomyxa viridis]|uniref:G7044 protein n=1 Tax=Coccomyxa viridis TaxID=1274662 RepID=A0ABP1FZ80_9CHLO